MEEKRRHPRYGCSRYRSFIAKYEDKNRVIGEIRNFSRSGLSFNSNDNLKNEEELDLSLKISGLDKEAPAKIQILWSKQNPDKSDYGARLVDMNPESKFDIMDLLYQDWRKSLGSDPLLS